MKTTGLADETVISQTTAEGRGPVKGRRLGDHLGRYHLLSRIGSGGMGEVYAAYDPELDRRVAIKVLHAGRHADEASVLRLRREAQALARLRHDNVVLVHDVGTVEGVSFLAMEFIEGQTLRRWLEQEHEVEALLRVFAAAGRGLDAAHKSGLVHRDFKPDNVMVDVSGRVVVMDFGLARGDEGPIAVRDAELASQTSSGAHSLLSGSGAASGSGSLTRTGAVMGTPAYMSPEQHLGQPTDARSDQFSWCVALWEALYGARPFAGRTVAKLAYAVTQGELSSPPAGVRVPSRVHRALVRGLSVKVGERWPDMAELVAVVDPDRRGLDRTRVGLGAAGLLSLGGLLWWATPSAGEASCPDYGASVESWWNADTREALRTHFERAPMAWREDARVRTVDALDRQVRALTEARTRACRETRVEALQSDEAMDLRMACLAERERELSTLIGVIEEADLSALAKASSAAQGLSEATSCLSVERLRGQQSGRPEAGFMGVEAAENTLARLAALRATGQIKAGLELVDATRGQFPEAAGLGLRARFAFWEGQLALDAREVTRAPTALTEAFALALDADRHALAAETATVMVQAIGELARDYPDAERWATLARHLGARIEADVEREAKLENNLGIALGVAGRQPDRYARAKSHYRRSVELYVRSFGEADPRVAGPLNNLGIAHEVSGEHAEARAAYERALGIMEAGLGPRHPRVGRVHNNLSSVLQTQGEFEAGLRHATQAVEIATGAFGEGAHATASAQLNRCWGLLHLQRLAQAREVCSAAQATFAAHRRPGEGERADVLVALAWLAELEGDYTQATELWDALVKMDIERYGPEDMSVCGDRSNLAHAHALASRWGPARREAEAALALASKKDEASDCSARAHLVLGMVAAEAGAKVLAREHLEQAAAYYDAQPPGTWYEKQNVAKLRARLDGEAPAR